MGTPASRKAPRARETLAGALVIRRWRQAIGVPVQQSLQSQIGVLQGPDVDVYRLFCPAGVNVRRRVGIVRFYAEFCPKST